MSSQKVLCHLSLENYGTSWVEAREIRKGFSVFYWDNEFYIRPTKIAHINRIYHWKLFAHVLMTMEEGFIAENDLTWVKVTGEKGLNADCLRLAWNYHERRSELLDWFIVQDDAVLSFVDQNFNIFDASDTEVLYNLIEQLQFVQSISILTLLGRFQLDASKQSVTSLIEKLRSERTDWILQRLAPYQERIEDISNQFSSEGTRIGAGMSGSKPSKRQIMKKWLEEYVIENGGMPIGEHDVHIPFLGGKVGVGLVDFDHIVSPT
jgi:hypothetical protein